MIEIFLQVEKLKQKKEVVDVEVENLKKCLQQLELEKSEIDGRVSNINNYKFLVA